MTTAAPTPAAAPPPPHRPAPQEPLILPGQRLTPSPGRDRPWRVLTVLLGSVVVLLVLLSLSVATVATWMTGRAYGDVPAITGLGTPSSLTLASDLGTVRVVPSGDVEQVTVALVTPGSTALPAPEETVRARITHEAGAQRSAVMVRQPEQFLGVPWTSPLRDVLLLIPEGHELALHVQADVGDVGVEGEFTSLHVQSDVGDLEIGPVAVAEELTASSQVGGIDADLISPAPAQMDLSAAVGDIDLALPADADGDISVTTELGDVRVALPGAEAWQVDARSELGDVAIDPSLLDRWDAEDGSLTITSDLGDITVTR